ncbi:hypothetical protein [Candidatus Oleimmundimicrobium sp.]|uniref:hypothetical protein n=1 Tax=Candidatus Oleimmundimicrobium sp. TaxID=3060597 RepID=UPI002727CBDE|nr:hypothetical protein [Candidatus Oleimmundimicrobium sp.]MDO8886076.1 hypothetical protein [Candidatus Oleimmundimicrobium sp.]
MRMRRYSWPFNGKRFIGNKDPDHMEVHDLDNENKNCQIDEINKENVQTFNPDLVHEAQEQGFNGCYWCLRPYHTE